VGTWHNVCNLSFNLDILVCWCAMILLTKQLLDESFSIEKIQLTADRSLQIAQIIDFDTDLIVSTSSAEAQQVIELAKLSRISFALYLPDLNLVSDYYEGLNHIRYRHMYKMLFLNPKIIKSYSKVLEQISENFTLIFEGDFKQAYEHLLFDVKEAELDFCLDCHE
jgi:hypothetical protein